MNIIDTMEILVGVMIIVAILLLLVPLVLSIIAINRSRKILAIEQQLTQLRLQLTTIGARKADQTVDAPPLSSPSNLSVTPSALSTSLLAVNPNLSTVSAINPAPPLQDHLDDKHPLDEPSPPLAIAPPISPIPSTASAPPEPPRPITLSPTPSVFKNLFGKIKDNWIVFAGAVIFFLGFSFFATAFAGALSREVRLILVASSAIATLLVGWWLRPRRPQVAMPLQGTAIAILILCVFVAQKNYHMIEQMPAFALLLVIMGLLGVLADLQKSLVMAMFGVVFGFAIPALVSTGGGTIQGLFGYFALLHVGIFWLSMRRLWPLLNITAFGLLVLFAFFWASERYHPDQLGWAQGFITLFFLIYYVIIDLGVRQGLPALKSSSANADLPSQDSAKTWINLPKYYSALIFLLPTIAYILLYGLWQSDLPTLALILFAPASLYLGHAWLWLKPTTTPLSPSLRPYVQTLILIGAVLVMNAVSCALSWRWTSAVWALSGLGMFGLALKQRNFLSLSLGLTLQIAGWLAFLRGVPLWSDENARGIFAQANQSVSLVETFFKGMIAGDPMMLTLIAVVLIFVVYRRSNAHEQKFGAIFINTLFAFFVGQMIWQQFLSGFWGFRNYGAITDTIARLVQLVIVLSIIGVALWLFYPRQQNPKENFYPAWRAIPAVLLILLALPFGHYRFEVINFGSWLHMISALGSAWLIEKHYWRNREQLPHPPMLASLLSNANTLLIPAGVFFLVKYNLPYLFYGFQSISPSIARSFSDYGWMNIALFTLLALTLLIAMVGVAHQARWNRLIVYGLIIWFYLAYHTLSQIAWGILYPVERLMPINVAVVAALLLASEYLYQQILRAYPNATDSPIAHLWGPWSKLMADRRWAHETYHTISRLIVSVFALLWFALGAQSWISHLGENAPNSSVSYWARKWMQSWSGDFVEETPLFDSYSSGYWAWALTTILAIGLLLIFHRSAKAVDHRLSSLTHPVKLWYRQRIVPFALLLLLLNLIARNFLTSPYIPPLPYIPLINPIDILSMMTLMLAIYLWHDHRSASWAKSTLLRINIGVLGALIFVWLSMMLVRTIVFFTDSLWTWKAIFHSSDIQPALSTLWTLIAMTTMVLCSRRQWRQGWMIGSGLLIVVIVKIFMIDMSNLSLLGYIFSFMVVGGLMLVIGYFSPIPPKNTRSTLSPLN